MCYKKVLWLDIMLYNFSATIYMIYIIYNIYKKYDISKLSKNTTILFLILV